jgi:hypothetical protein
MVRRRKIMRNAQMLWANSGEFAMGRWRIAQEKDWEAMRRARKSPMREKSCRATSFIAPLIKNKTTTIRMRISKGPMILFTPYPDVH